MSNVEITILDVKIDWRAGWSNRPGFKVLLNRIPELIEMRYLRENGIYYARKGAYVSFFAHNKDDPEENAGGFYGRVFEIMLWGDKRINLRGPWSSRAGYINKQGFGACADALITTDLKAMEGKGTFYAGAIFIDSINEWCEKHDNEINWLIVQKVEKNGEITYEPRLKDNDNPCTTCKGLKEYVWAGTKKICSSCNGTGKNDWVLISDIAREFRMQTQYLSHYIGGLGKAPDLSKDLRIRNNNFYHQTAIWYEDVDEFKYRVRKHRLEICPVCGLNPNVTQSIEQQKDELKFIWKNGHCMACDNEKVIK